MEFILQRMFNIVPYSLNELLLFYARGLPRIYSRGLPWDAMWLAVDLAVDHAVGLVTRRLAVGLAEGLAADWRGTTGEACHDTCRRTTGEACHWACGDLPWELSWVAVGLATGLAAACRHSPWVLP